jgi:protein phosphatase
MGGHRRGEVASAIVVDCVAEFIGAVQDEDDIIRLLAEANMRVFHAMAAPNGSPAMGSTVVGMVVSSRKGWIFNVGDSRAYLMSGSELRRVSRDHTPDRPTSGARSHALTQSLGGTLSPVPLAPHITTFDPELVDTVLLCSDGLTDMVEDDEIEALLQRSPEDPTRTLLDAALDAGGLDNVTIVVVRLKG